jgi:hypothetical protein
MAKATKSAFLGLISISPLGTEERKYLELKLPLS